MWKFVSNEPNENESKSEATEICDDKTQNKKRTITKNHPSIIFREKGRKKKIGYGEKSIDDFRLAIVDPSPKLDSEKSNILSSY